VRMMSNRVFELIFAEVNPRQVAEEMTFGDKLRNLALGQLEQTKKHEVAFWVAKYKKCVEEMKTDGRFEALAAIGVSSFVLDKSTEEAGDADATEEARSDAMELLDSVSEDGIRYESYRELRHITFQCLRIVW
jgi:hypothetical protein